MVCGGDVVVVTRDARFALTEVRLGIPPAQIAPYVVRRIGLAAARRIMLTAAEFDGAGAWTSASRTSWPMTAANSRPWRR